MIERSVINPKRILLSNMETGKVQNLRVYNAYAIIIRDINFGLTHIHHFHVLPTSTIFRVLYMIPLPYSTY